MLAVDVVAPPQSPRHLILVKIVMIIIIVVVVMLLVTVMLTIEQIMILRPASLTLSSFPSSQSCQRGTIVEIVVSIQLTSVGAIWQESEITIKKAEQKPR